MLLRCLTHTNSNILACKQDMSAASASFMSKWQMFAACSIRGEDVTQHTHARIHSPRGDSHRHPWRTKVSSIRVVLVLALLLVSPGTIISISYSPRRDSHRHPWRTRASCKEGHTRDQLCFRARIRARRSRAPGVQAPACPCTFRCQFSSV